MSIHPFAETEAAILMLDGWFPEAVFLAPYGEPVQTEPNLWDHVPLDKPMCDCPKSPYAELHVRMEVRLVCYLSSSPGKWEEGANPEAKRVVDWLHESIQNQNMKEIKKIGAQGVVCTTN